MKATDYIFFNKYNKALPFGIEFYTETNGVLGINYVGFSTIGEAIDFIDNNNLSFYKQR